MNLLAKVSRSAKITALARIDRAPKKSTSKRKRRVSARKSRRRKTTRKGKKRRSAKQRANDKKLGRMAKARARKRR